MILAGTAHQGVCHMKSGGLRFNVLCKKREKAILLKKSFPGQTDGRMDTGRLLYATLLGHKKETAN